MCPTVFVLAMGGIMIQQRIAHEQLDGDQGRTARQQMALLAIGSVLGGLVLYLLGPTLT